MSLSSLFGTRKRSQISKYARTAAAAKPDFFRPLRHEFLEDRRLLTAGDLDTSFDGDGRVLTDLTWTVDRSHDYGGGLAIQGNGKIVVAGLSRDSATSAPNESRLRVTTKTGVSIHRLIAMEKSVSRSLVPVT